jgi:hypothetical protein
MGTHQNHFDTGTALDSRPPLCRRIGKYLSISTRDSGAVTCRRCLKLMQKQGFSLWDWQKAKISEGVKL